LRLLTGFYLGAIAVFGISMTGLFKATIKGESEIAGCVTAGVNSVVSAICSILDELPGNKVETVPRIQAAKAAPPNIQAKSWGRLIRFNTCSIVVSDD
jgi:hypothetical protein